MPADHPPSPLATSEDLRGAAYLIDLTKGGASERTREARDALSNRVESLASALDQLHATPGLVDAMRTADALVGGDERRNSPQLLGHLDVVAIKRLLSALRLLTHPGETS